MDEELIRKKYIMLQRNLYTIKGNLITLLEKYEQLFSLVKDGFIIDGEVNGSVIFKELKDNLDVVNNSLVNELIPKVNDKI